MDQKYKNTIFVQDDRLGSLARTAYENKLLKKESGNLEKEAVDTIKGIIADLGGGPVQVENLLLVPEHRAGKLNIDQYKKRLIARGIDPRVLEEEAKQAVNAPYVALRILPMQDSRER